MKGDCKLCGLPLTRGNIKVVRPKGKKRPYRIHRRCPVFVQAPPVKLEFFTGKTGSDKDHSWKGDTAANVPQKPQNTADAVVAYETVYEVIPPRYRFFMTSEQADRVKAAVEKNLAGIGVGFEVIPVPEDEVDRNPDVYDALVEVIVNWKIE